MFKNKEKDEFGFSYLWEGSNENKNYRELTKPKSDRLGEKTRLILGEPGCLARGTDASGVTIRFSIWKVRTPKARLFDENLAN